MSLIQKDLKNIPIETLNSECWPGEFISPFHYHEQSSEIVSLPAAYFTKAPRIVEWFRTSRKKASDVNRDILSSLAYGTQGLIIDGYSDTQSLKEILQDVYTDMIETSVLSSGESISSDEMNVIWRIPIQTNNSNLTADQLSSLFTHSNGNIKFVFNLNSAGEWIHHTTELFSTVKRLIELTTKVLSPEEAWQKIIIVFETDPSYLKQIMQTRALQLVCLNLNAPKSIPVSPIEVHIKGGTMDPDKYFIQATSAAMAAALTGVQGICIHPLSGGEPDYHTRVLRNIHHLLDLESRLYKGRDPLAGAYAIDHYSKKWAEDILKGII